MALSPAEHGRLYNELSKVLGQDLAGDLMNAIPDSSVRFDTLETRFDNLETRFDRLETRFDSLETRFDNLETRFDHLEIRFDRLEARFDRHFCAMLAFLAVVVGWLFYSAS